MLQALLRCVLWLIKGPIYMFIETLEALYLDTVKLGIGLIILMCVNIVMGMVNSFFSSNFQTEKVLKGLGKSIILILCFCATYMAGLLNKETLSIGLGEGEPVDIIDAMHALLLAGYFMYSKKVITQMGEIIGTNTQQPDKKD